MRKSITRIMLLAYMLALVGISAAQAQTVSKYVGPTVYDQISTVGSSSQYSYVRYNASSVLIATSYKSADDFMVPRGSNWTIGSVYAKGYCATTLDYLDGFNVTIFSDNNLKPDTVYKKYTNLKSFFINTTDGVVVYFGENLTLKPGAYWISVQAVNKPHASNYYAWRWYYQSTTAAVINEPMYYKSYTSAATEISNAWTTANTATTKYNFAYSLHSWNTKDVTCQLSTPVTGALLTPQTVGVKVINLGKDTASGFNVTYVLDDTVSVTETYSAKLPPLATQLYNFTTPANFNTKVGVHSLKAIVKLTGDQNTTNDTVTGSVENYGILYYADVVNNDTIQTSEGRYVDVGGITGNILGNTNTYTVTFKPGTSQQRSTLTFNQCQISNASGTTEYGRLFIYDGPTASSPLISKVGYITTTSTPVTYTATNATGELTAVYTGLGTTSSTAYGWIASVGSVDAKSHDVAINSITYPEYEGNFTTTDSVTVAVKNYGYNDETNLQISYTINGGTPVTETIASLASGQLLNYTFAQKVDLSAPTTYMVDVALPLVSDEVQANNTISKKLTNWGHVYNIGVAGVLMDTVEACSGVLTDEGGTQGTSGANYGWMIGPTYTTLIKPSAGKRAQLEFKSVSIKSGRMTIFNGPTADYDTIANFTGRVIPSQKFYSTDSTGMLFVSYQVPQTAADSGFIAKISCIDIASNDLDVTNIRSTQKVYFTGDTINVLAIVRNLGTNTYGSKVKLLVNGVAVDSLETGNLNPDDSLDVQFSYVPTVGGSTEFKIQVDNDDYLANNSLSVNHIIYPKYSLAESFESSKNLPDYWSYKTKKYSIIESLQAYHGKNLMTVTSIDTIMTPRLKIEAGDSFNFYSMIDAPGQFVPAPGNLRLGWYDYNTQTYHMFAQTIVLGYNFTKYTFDISEAAGNNSIVIYNTVNNGTFYLEMISGPERYFEPNDADVRSIYVPELAKVGEPMDVKVGVRNIGENTLAGANYTVELYDAGTQSLLTSVQGVDIEKDAYSSINLSYVFDAPTFTSLYAKVNFAADANLANNSSAAKMITVVELSNSYYQIGDSSGRQNAYPIAVSSNSSLSQTIYRKDTVDHSGIITALAWNTNYAADMPNVYIKIWMAETDSNSVGNAWVPFNQFKQVFADSVDMIAANGKLYLKFDSTFTYTGAKNLAIMAYQYTADNTKYYQYHDYQSYVYPDYITRYYTKTTGDIDMGAVPAGTRVYYAPVATLFFDESALVNLEVQDVAGSPIENAAIEVIRNEATVLTDTTDSTGKVAFENIAINKTYNFFVSAPGYEVLTLENVTITADSTLPVITLSPLTKPANVAVEVNHNEKSAVLSWGGSKAFNSYRVYLDSSSPLDSAITETTFAFAGLTDGMHIAGVQSIYDGGVSEVVVDTFYIHYAVDTVMVEPVLEKMRAEVTWTFAGTSNLLQGFVISIDSVAVDTVTELAYRANNLLPGFHSVGVASLYTSGIATELFADLVLPVAPTSLTALAEVGSISTYVNWACQGADSFNIYLNDLTIPFEVGVLDTAYVFNYLPNGNHTIGVSAFYSGVESEIVVTTVVVAEYSEPVAPQNLVAQVAIGVTEVEIAWDSLPADSYSIYVDDLNVPVVENVTDTVYTLTNLSYGTHLVAVSAIYSGVESAKSLISIEIVPATAPSNLVATAEVNATEAKATWSKLAADSYNVYIDNLETALAKGVTDTTYLFSNLAVGSHVIGVSAVYGTVESALTLTTVEITVEVVEIVAPTNLVAAITPGSDEAVVTWESPAADSYKVYLDDLSTAVATGITAKTYTITNLDLGTHVVGVSAVYAGVESDITLTTFGVTVGIENQSLADLNIYPNPTNGLVTVSCPVNSNIEVFNMAGVKLMTVLAESTKNTLSLDKFESGSYIIVVKNNNEVNYLSVQLTK